MKRLYRHILSFFLAIAMICTSTDVTALAADTEGHGYTETILYNSSYIINSGYNSRFKDIDLRNAAYVKVEYEVHGRQQYYDSGQLKEANRKECWLSLWDPNASQYIDSIYHDINASNVNFTDVFWRKDGEAWNYPVAGLCLYVNRCNLPADKVWASVNKVIVGYANYKFTVDSNYNHMGEYREKIHTGEGTNENGKIVYYPKPYFTGGSGNHVEENTFIIGQTVSASVWEGGTQNSQGVTADGSTVNYRGFKLAKPGASGELSGFITTSDSFTFDANFLSKYRDYLSSDGTFTLVPVYEPKYQAVQFLNDYGSVDGKADAKGVYDGFRSGYTLGATKLDTIRVGAKANSGYNISSMVLQSPNGAFTSELKNGTKKWTNWKTRNNATGSPEGVTLAAAVNYRGQMYTNEAKTRWSVQDYCRVMIYYGDASSSLTIMPSPQSVTGGEDCKRTVVKAPGTENDPNFNSTIDAGASLTIPNLHLFMPYIFSASPKSGYHAYWEDGTLDTNGDGVADTKIPGYTPFANSFGDQFKFIPQVPVKNKIYYNLVKDINVAKDVKSLPLKGQLLLSDRLLLSGKKVQKGIGGVTVFASGFKAGQEVTTNADGYYELESNNRFQYYDLYNYNVTFTGESEAGTIGVVYSQNPSKLGEVIVDATADVDITDVKLLLEQDKKDKSGKEYVTVDTSDAMVNSSNGYFSLPGGDRNFRLQMNAHRGSEVLVKGVLTFTNVSGSKVRIDGSEDASHSGLFTFDFNPKAKGITAGATARVTFYVGERALLSRDAGIRVTDNVGTIRIVNYLAGTSSLKSPQAAGAAGDQEISRLRAENSSIAELVNSAGQPITMAYSGDFDDIANNLSNIYMDGSDRVISVGFGRKILSLGGEKEQLMDLARTAARAQDEAGEAVSAVVLLKKQIASAGDGDKADLEAKLKEAENELSDKKKTAEEEQSRLDTKIRDIQSENREQAKFDDNLPMELGFSCLMTFGYDSENGKWYFKDMLYTASVDADSDATVNSETGLSLTTGVGMHLKGSGRATFVAEERQDLTDEGRREKRYYITDDNKDSFDIFGAAGNGEERRLDSYGRLILNPSVTLTGLSGLADDLVQVEVDGRAAYDLVYSPASDGLGECALNASVKVKTMNYTDRISLSDGIYQTGGSVSNAAILNALNADPESGYLNKSVDTLEAEDLSYMEGEDTWYGGENDAEHEPAVGEALALSAIDEGGFEAYSEERLANRIASDASYDMVSLGDGKFAAVFLNAAQSRIRDKNNAKAAYYTYYDGNEWSEPELLEDDDTLDLYPYIYSLGEQGALIVWSSVHEDYKDADNKIERQNALDLHGRFVGIDGTLSESIRITETVTEAFTADRAIGVAVSGDKLVMIYEKREYGSLSDEAMVRDMLYPKSSRIAYRTYDMVSGKWGEEKLCDGYLPETGMLLDSDAATIHVKGKNIGVLAYTVDTDGDPGTLYDRELYLSTYDFETDSFAPSRILMGHTENTETGDTRRFENSSPKFAGTENDLYLLWLKDGDIVEMNIGEALENDSVSAPSTLVYGSIAADSEGLQTGAISAFDAETDGKHIYVIWPQEADDKPESLKDGLKDIQMWGVRADIADGILSETTNPVQITSHYGERYDDVAFGVYNGEIYGMASKIPSRIITGSEAREVFGDSYVEAAFVPYAIWDDTGAVPVTFRVSENGKARIKNAGFLDAKAGGNAFFSCEIHNYSFSELNGAKVEALSDNGSCTLYQYVPSETEDGEGETIATTEGVNIDGLGGGGTYIVTGSLPLKEDAAEAAVTITLTDARGNSVDYTTITKELTPDITLRDISIAETGVRNLYRVKGSVINEGTARAEGGVISLVSQRGSQDKTLKQIEYPALMPGESYEFGEFHEDGEKYLELTVSDDDFTVSEETTMNSGKSEEQGQSAENAIIEELRLYAAYSDRIGSCRIPVQEAFFGGEDKEYSFITRSITQDALEEVDYVTGVQVDAVKAVEDEEGNLTGGEIVSNGKGSLTIEVGETVDIQASILTNSPRKGAQAMLDQNDRLIQTSTGTEGLVYHYEYIGDNAEIHTDGMLQALNEGSGKLKVYVYPDISGCTAENTVGDYTTEIDGDEFQTMNVEESYEEDSYHTLPAAAIRTFVLDVNIVGVGERTGTSDFAASGGIQYRLLNETEAAVCGVEEGKTPAALTIPARVKIGDKSYNVTRIDAYAFHKDNHIKKVSVGKNVTLIGAGAFEGLESLKKVTFGNALTEIGEGAFKNCAALSAIVLPAKLERIDGEAFYGLTGIKTLTIPANVAYIGDRAFYGCAGLKKITIKSEKLTGDNLGSDVFTGVPQDAEYQLAIREAAVKDRLIDILTDESEQVTDKKGIVYSISSKADRTFSVTGLTVSAAAKLKSVSIPAQVTWKGGKYTVTGIAEGAFEKNTRLTSITIPKTVTAVGERAFAGDTELKSITIPKAVRTLGAKAFNGCAKLTKVTISSPELKVGEDAFEGVPDTAAFKYAFQDEAAIKDLRAQLLSESQAFVSGDGLQYEILDPELPMLLLTGSINKEIKKLTVPDTVTYRGAKLHVAAVQDGAFAYHKKLTKVVLGKNVFEIDPDAFAGCTSLASVTMKGAENIWFSAFKGCTSLKKITLPKTVRMIGNDTFKGCAALETVTIQSASPTELETIGIDAFEDISENAVFKISAKQEDKEKISKLLTESGVDEARIK
ncbi:MAG: leucine-rich repeat protein [Lachnospiraceae bacterium]|nr:leucine-rich repeat protein [Lachnospiraceae bacterium]